MAHGMHPETQLIHDGVRVNLRIKPLPKRGGGVLNREIAEVADAVVILPLLAPENKDEKTSGDTSGRGVVLIRNERFAVKDTLWELPAGTLEPGEDPAECALRELEEETGYRATEVQPITSFWASPGFSTERMHAFVATGLSKTAQQLDETERIVPEVRRWEDTLAMCRSGEIADGKSLATILWWATFGEAGDHVR